MYSYEERIRAVKLYIKLGKRVAATIKIFGRRTGAYRHAHVRLADRSTVQGGIGSMY
jgi:hypothetical protein